MSIVLTRLPALLIARRSRRTDALTPSTVGFTPRVRRSGLRHQRELHDRHHVDGQAVPEQPGALRPDEAHRHSVDTIVDELAERWSWQESYHKLDFVPRNDVKGHDGRPFSSRDVKHTFDTLREAPDARPGRLSPRRNSGEEALPWSARREFRG